MCISAYPEYRGAYPSQPDADAVVEVWNVRAHSDRDPLARPCSHRWQQVVDHREVDPAEGYDVEFVVAGAIRRKRLSLPKRRSISCLGGSGACRRPGVGGNSTWAGRLARKMSALASRHVTQPACLIFRVRTATTAGLGPTLGLLDVLIVFPAAQGRGSGLTRHRRCPADELHPLFSPLRLDHPETWRVREGIATPLCSAVSARPACPTAPLSAPVAASAGTRSGAVASAAV